jgi:hypothetical protein
MSSARFQPAIPAIKQAQNHALDCAATGISFFLVNNSVNFQPSDTSCVILTEVHVSWLFLVRCWRDNQVNQAALRTRHRAFSIDFKVMKSVQFMDLFLIRLAILKKVECCLTLLRWTYGLLFHKYRIGGLEASVYNYRTGYLVTSVYNYRTEFLEAAVYNYRTGCPGNWVYYYRKECHVTWVYNYRTGCLVTSVYNYRTGVS